MFRDIWNAIKDDPWGFLSTVFVSTILVGVLMFCVIVLVNGAHEKNAVHYDNEYCHTTSVFTGFMEINKIPVAQYRSETTCITPVVTAIPTRSPQ